ncbi:hypothetical protein TrRE_jg5840 [Triparma retinervis]|uniref:RNA helicase n=1 Tax=Triparma retinervis TaxID=2557542 RepID=A0A9W7F4P6_9STRA|nr:hypothetical protein TrRE_jg5840 [Triparma retinervis]
MLPTAIQEEAIPLILGGGDVLAAAETGSGKTGAFALPVLQLCVEEYREKREGRRGLVKTDVRKEEPRFVMSTVDRDSSISLASGGLTVQTRKENGWAGVRCTTGVSSGSYSFTVKCEDEGIVRAGVASSKARLELGKDPVSYGFGGTGVKVQSSNFEKWGESYGKGDVVGCYFSIEQDGRVKVGWTKNGKDLGIGYDEIVEKSKLEGGLFPMVAMKNAQCTFDLGAGGLGSLGGVAFSRADEAVQVKNESAGGIQKAGGEDYTSGWNGDGPLAIVLEPVRDLAEQTYNTFASLASNLNDPPIKSALLVGGYSPKPVLERLKNNDVDVLVGTVPIISQFMKQKKINPKRCKFFVLDEADQLAEKDNVEGVKAIYNMLPRSKSDLQVCFFSATLHSDSVKSLVSEICSKPMWIDLKGKESVPDTVHHCVIRVDPKKHDMDNQVLAKSINLVGSEAKKWVITDAVHHKYGKVEEEVEWDIMSEEDKMSQRVKAMKPVVLLKLIEQLDMEQVLVFCRTNLDCDNLEKFFIAAGGGNKFSGKKEGGKQGIYSCCVLAGMRGQQERKRNLEAFKDGDVRILIATDVAARGIDVSGLPYVVNMTLPEQSENYIHRVGRVGRAERMGLAISLVAANVKEKVWWCQNKKKPPQFDRRLFDEGGNCKWQSEGKMMHEVEKRLGNLKVTPIQLPHLDLPPEIQQMLKSGGYGEMQGTDASNPEFAIHLAELVGEVRELGALEFNLQTNWLRSVYRKAQEGEGEGEMVGEMKIGANGKHASSMFGGLNLPGEEGGPK